MNYIRNIGGIQVWRRGKTGLFALRGKGIDPSDIRAAISFWKKEGCERAFGPVCAGAADVGGGICVWRSNEEPELLPGGGEGSEPALLAAGFTPAGEEYAFRFTLPTLPDRPGMKVTPGVSPRSCARVMGAPMSLAALSLLSLWPHIRRRYCFTAWRDGPKGILICLSRGKRIRILTLWAAPDSRNGAACLPLLHALVSAAKKHGVDTIDAARIPADNPHSLRLARALGGRPVARYRTYSLTL